MTQVNISEEEMILAMYIDNYITASNKEGTLKRAVMKLASKFEVTDKVAVNEYLWVKIERKQKGSKKFYQLHLT